MKFEDFDKLQDKAGRRPFLPNDHRHHPHDVDPAEVRRYLADLALMDEPVDWDIAERVAAIGSRYGLNAHHLPEASKYLKAIIVNDYLMASTQQNATMRMPDELRQDAEVMELQAVDLAANVLKIFEIFVQIAACANQLSWLEKAEEDQTPEALTVSLKHARSCLADLEPDNRQILQNLINAIEIRQDTQS